MKSSTPRKAWKRLLIDSLIAALLILSIEQALYYAYDNFKLFDILEPIEKAFTQSNDDYELTDFVFARLKNPKPVDDRITLVNIGWLSRVDIAKILETINKHRPAVVGVDTFFRIDKDSLGDATLEEAFKNTQNLVLVHRLAYNPKTDSFDSLVTSLSRFARHAQFGFSNLISPESENQNDVVKVREVVSQESVDGLWQKAFSVKLVEVFEPEKAEKFLARNNDIEVINYSGNIVETEGRLSTRFRAIDINDVLEERFNPDLIRGKIIILGFLGEYIGDDLSSEDKYFTPLYEEYDETGDANMFGAVVHANIASMILDEDYIDSPSDALMNAIIISLLLTNVFVFSYFYYLIPQWYHGTTKLIQAIQIIALMYIMIYSFHYFNYELYLWTSIAHIALVGDSLEVYYGVIKKLFSKYGRRQLFKRERLPTG